MITPWLLFDGILVLFIASALSLVAVAGFNHSTSTVWYPMYFASYNASLTLFAMNVHYGLFREGWKKFNFAFWALFFTVLSFLVTYSSIYIRDERIGNPVLPPIMAIVRAITSSTGQLYFPFYVYCSERGWPTWRSFDMPFWVLSLP
ncbi:hypothetical protein AAMO2058_000982400, partial [Amorphochlora amoebiformis]